MTSNEWTMFNREFFRQREVNEVMELWGSIPTKDAYCQTNTFSSPQYVVSLLLVLPVLVILDSM